MVHFGLVSTPPNKILVTGLCGFFSVPQLFNGCETGPPAYSPYPRRLASLTICWCNYKGTTFYSYFKTLSVGPAGVELTTSRVTAQCSKTEPPVRGVLTTFPQLICYHHFCSHHHHQKSASLSLVYFSVKAIICTFYSKCIASWSWEGKKAEGRSS